MIARSFVMISMGLAMLGCRGSTEPTFDARLKVTTDRTQYQLVQPVVATTTNDSDRTIYDDHCGGELQGFEFLKRWNGSYGEARMCIDYTGWPAGGVAIPPHSMHVDTFYVNYQAYTGTWRIRLHLRNEFGVMLREDLSTSNTFGVQGTWTP